MNPKVIEKLGKEGYRLVGSHSAIKVCLWTKKALQGKGVCYKEKFYGISSHRCVQMSCSLFNCQNKCIHCWRDLNYTVSEKVKKPDNPEKIVDDCINEQKKILQGFRSNENVAEKKFAEAMAPKQFAISLTGEATLYPLLSDLILELKKRKITSFLVTNGLNPKALEKLFEKNALPTQLYISLNSPGKKAYSKWHNSKSKNAWAKFNKSLKLMKKLGKKTRTALRLTLVKDLNMIEPENYVKLIKKASPNFVEIKAFMSVGYSRKRLGYDRMPLHSEVKSFAEKINNYLNYDFAGESTESRVVLLSSGKKKLKIKKDD
ncbi:MAG: 4-demethylwyosine synthase TYW1 [Candidatus ainarchaeum sp.]|nr:4-demethylwyosine synthase TYW1 [Candidatus ainarchaeum sp.]